MWLLIPILILALYFFLKDRRVLRREELLSEPAPVQWRDILKSNVPLFKTLPAELQQRLLGYVNVFVGEKQFIGCGGLEITDEIKVTIAAQACLLLLGRSDSFYPNLESILVYPSDYVSRQPAQEGGIVMKQESIRAGESWRRGPIVLSWDAVRRGASDITDGQNVVFHEFAHNLDQEDGSFNGAPLLSPSQYGAWTKVLSEEFDLLKDAAEHKKESLMDKYGATSPSEFFAVATETFFEKPHQLKDEHPELYEQLKGYYLLDPAAWTGAESE